MSYEWFKTPDDELSTLRYYARKLQRHPTFGSLKKPLNVVKLAASHSLRMATQRWRHLPTAVIAGAAKAGTTQLHAYLIRHPRCFSGAEKEVRYFTLNTQRSVQWYRSRFPLRRTVERVEGHVIDATPSYMMSPDAVWRMRAVLPDARIIVILRDPTARAYSHFQHAKTRHRDTRSFEEAIDSQLAENLYPPQLGGALKADAPPMMSYLARGYYALQIECMYSLYPRDRVLVLDSADLFADTNAACQRVFEFLGLEPHDVHPNKVYNRGYYREKIDPQIAERLRQHYRPYDELLVRVTGRRFSWMEGAAAGITSAAA